jgi:methylthioxylose transferase
MRVESVDARIGGPSTGSGRRLQHAQRRKSWVHRLADPLALAVALALIGVSAYVGHGLKEHGLPIFLPRPPLLAFWHPHLGWGTPLSVLCVLVGLRLQRVAAELGWRRLLFAGWLLNLAWLCSLALIDGLRMGWIDVLLDPNEYLRDVPRINDPAAFVATFTHFVAFGDGVDGTNVWTTHVAGHPPLATLVFWLLARIGLGGGFWAGALCILVASAASVAIPVTLRELGAGAAARRVVPNVALFPGAIWMAVSADGLFAGVATSGLALVCIGAARGRLLASLLGGVLLGTALFLSYGLVLFGIVVLTATAVSVHQQGLRPSVGSWLVACAGVAAVAAVHLAYGFNWLAGLTQLRIRYYQGIASQRPLSYFAYANLAAWLISCSPLLAIAISRSIGVLARWRSQPWTEDRIVALLALSGALAALVADLSALSKAETERIWLTFGVVATSGLALLRGRGASWALAGGAGWAILVNHLFNTGW